MGINRIFTTNFILDGGKKRKKHTPAALDQAEQESVQKYCGSILRRNNEDFLIMKNEVTKKSIRAEVARERAKFNRLFPGKEKLDVFSRKILIMRYQRLWKREQYPLEIRNLDFYA